ncbi:MAG: LysR family transcriptional regulator [Alphaproteobacteria bacterium]|nr:LysR family transcriptional regulator [Alphaproteobacteria bacterium]
MRLLAQLNYIDMVAKTGSIRRAADQLNITSTALNRRILALEDELGTPIFERLPQGVRLNTAGELLIQHIRHSMAELAKVTSQIADLSGVRRGHINIAGGSEVIGTFLPQHIARYRRDHPQVSFDILRRAPEAALKALTEFEADLSLVFGAVPPTVFQSLATVELNITVAMRKGHPLAEHASLRWMDCLDYPAILPAEGSGLHHILMAAQLRKGMPLRKVISSESFEFMLNYSRYEDALAFILPFGEVEENPDMVVRRFDDGDAIEGRLHLVQTKGRVLPVAAAKFAETLIQHFNATFPARTT